MFSSGATAPAKPPGAGRTGSSDHAARHQQPVEPFGIGAGESAIDIEYAAIFDRGGDATVELGHLGGHVLVGHDRGALEGAVGIFAPQHHRIDAHGSRAVRHGRPQAGVDIEIGQSLVVAMQVEHDVVADAKAARSRVFSRWSTVPNVMSGKSEVSGAASSGKPRLKLVRVPKWKRP